MNDDDVKRIREWLKPAEPKRSTRNRRIIASRGCRCGECETERVRHAQRAREHARSCGFWNDPAWDGTCECARRFEREPYVPPAGIRVTELDPWREAELEAAGRVRCESCGEWNESDAAECTGCDLEL